MPRHTEKHYGVDRLKEEYLRFIRWDGEIALFKKAKIWEIIMYGMGISHVCHALDIEEGKIILIRVPKLLTQSTQGKEK